MNFHPFMEDHLKILFHRQTKDAVFVVVYSDRLQVEAGGSSFFTEGPLGGSTCGGGTCVAQVMPDCAW